MENNVTGFSTMCNKLVGIDPRIRFVGVADKHGLILTTAEREGIIPLLNDEETEQYAITASTRQYTRLRWQDLLGKLHYTCSLYEKILRITVPITSQKNRLEYLLIFTLDPNTEDFDYLIMKKVIPMVTDFFSRILTKSP
ncbi:MAG TPA: hypothetical protein VFT71_02680 [Candidatus Nitrosocosmicus sp.]|nr:hypothetical protein [Candidatus Nitrosocosmicus sp.]